MRLKCVLMTAVIMVTATAFARLAFARLVSLGPIVA